MPFNYYHRLSRRQQSIYRESDGITEVDIGDARTLLAPVRQIESALGSDDLDAVQSASGTLATDIVRRLEIPPVRVKVLARRPSDDWGELHGLYEPEEAPRHARITVWMRTAKRANVVAFKTYLRTLLHELGHHLDYEYYRLEESFHTEGFYKRENHMFQALTGALSPSEPVQQQLFPGM